MQFEFDDVDEVRHQIPDLSRLGLDEDDELTIGYSAGGSNPLFAADLLAALKQQQQQLPRTGVDMSPFASFSSGQETDPRGSRGKLGSTASPSSSSTTMPTVMDPVRAAAAARALQALQARSRHPQPWPELTNSEDPNRPVTYDPSLYSSLPADIGSLECTVYIQYLPVTMKESELMNLITEHGEPKRVRICGNPKKDHNWTYGFVEYGSPDEAARFIEKCDGIRAGTYRMRCNIAKTPIVDRLAVDAGPDCKCTFALKFPNRSLRDLILASINSPEEQNGGIATNGAAQQMQAMPPKAMGLVSPTPTVGTIDANTITPLMFPVEFTVQLSAAVVDALRFSQDRAQSHFFAAKGVVQNVLEQAKRRNETLPMLSTAALLNGSDPVFFCRLLLTALHVLHGSHDDALRYALSALQSIPTPLAVVAYLDAVDKKGKGEQWYPRGLTPLLLNHLTCFGIVLESVSTVAARAFFHLVQHRAAQHGYPASKAIDGLLASEPLPVSKGGNSLQRLLLPLIATQPGAFPGYFLASLTPHFTVATSCVSVYTYAPAFVADSPEQAAANLRRANVDSSAARSAW